MAEKRHDCPAPGCTHTLPFHKFACQKHWYSLPPELRTRLSREWRSGDLVVYLASREEAVAMLSTVPRMTSRETPQQDRAAPRRIE